MTKSSYSTHDYIVNKSNSQISLSIFPGDISAKDLSKTVESLHRGGGDCANSPLIGNRIREPYLNCCEIFLLIVKDNCVHTSTL